MRQLYRVPPSPDVMAALWVQYVKFGKPSGLSFKEYLAVIGFTNPADGQVGMDDGANLVQTPAGPELITVPQRPVTGRVHIKVLLIDFPDRVGNLPVERYEDLLFSQGIYPTGSMHDYYHEVSLGKVKITGSVHGWIRMPNPYSFYTNNESGTKSASYPRNAQRMAEDAVKTAINLGIGFEPELDVFGQGIVTALFLVHAGRGAETLHPTIRGTEIWSHKWQLNTPVGTPSGLLATIYLTVPHDCKIGVCAHELGHLVFQWQDFYDPNYDEDGHEWDGSGVWDLMAGGSYNGNSARPAHPAALHKLQHKWVEVETITSSTHVDLEPYTATTGRVIKVKSKAYTKKQYLLLENRTRQGFDFDLPGEGLLVWRVDEDKEQTNPDNPGLLLIQGDGRHDLESPEGWNQGDAGDPFPRSQPPFDLTDQGELSTSFEGGKRSGIRLSNIKYDVQTKCASLDIEFAK